MDYYFEYHRRNNPSCCQYYQETTSSQRTSASDPSLPPTLSGTCSYTGLKNFGNTCFLNSIIQCLYSLEPFVRFILSHEVEGATKKGVFKPFQELFRSMYNTNSNETEGKLDIFVRAIQSIQKESGASIIAAGQQHDSQEFAIYLLNWLHDDLTMVKTEKKNNNIKPISDLKELKQYYKNILEDYQQNNTSLLHLFFLGVACSTKKCENHQPPILSLKLTPSFPLQIQLPVDTTEKKIEDLLAKYFDEEKIEEWKHDGMNDSCKTKGQKSRMGLFKPPPFLIIHLKRYNNSDLKNKTKVLFPASNELDFRPYSLDTSRFIEDDSESYVYTLRAFSLHTGSTGGGHYTAYTRGWGEGNDWWLCDDPSVTKVNEGQKARFEESRDTAYVYFFQQKKALDLEELREEMTSLNNKSPRGSPESDEDGESFLVFE